MKQLILIVLAFAFTPHTSKAAEITPSAEQTTLLRDTLKESGKIRVVSGKQDSTGHGPITYYQVPFREGTFSASWKVEKVQSVAFIFDARNQGKATHLLKIYVNGGPGTKSRRNP